ncbi:echinoderm microtubule-associated protein-like 3 isoform X1 [Sphaerodactylus townsendi]|uniref:echinoderm microtubule-associated protein-like 3 isoform X1 n=2 Tax=Sphaerodactylus townsendi TaxID=933632 RepID=UPI002026491B|nr:echinoderm microtubule-associated protein-like 3 isoform X1 [Sphaerodactylus townsendi]
MDHGYLEHSAGGDNFLDSTSVLDHPDWLTRLNSRLQSQEEELTLVKSALADALRRLSFYDQQIPLLRRQVLEANSIPSQAGDPATLPRDNGACWILPPALSNDSSSPAAQKTRDRTELLPGAKRTQGSRVSVGTQTEESAMLALRQGQSLINGHGRGEPAHIPTNTGERDYSGHPACGIQDNGADLGFASEVRKVQKEPQMQGDGCSLLDACSDDIEDIGEAPPEDSSEKVSSEGQTQPSTHPLEREAPSPGSPSEESTAASPVPAVQSLMSSKKELLRRNSSSDKPTKTKQRLTKKAASSANLLNRSSSLDNRTKDPILSPGPLSTRRMNYNQERNATKMFLRGRPITMYIPSAFPNYDELRMELPSEKLQLDWVYGYRGRDCRSNLYVLTSGELVYFIACVVVLYHVQNRTQRHYLRHTDCVRCLAVHPDKVRVASGQMAGVDKDGKPLQPFVHIWDSSTLLPLQQIGLGSFERGVGSLAFSTADDGMYLCVVDESNEHMLSIWDCSRATKQAEIKSTNESVLTVEFNPQDSNNIITTGKSHVYFWTWSGNSLTKKQGIFGKYKKPKFIQCFVFDTNSDVLTGDSEGNILTWARVAADVRTLGKGAKETYQISKQTRAHEGSIFSLCLCRDGTVLSGGGKDRRIVQWSPGLTLLQELEIPEQFGAVRTIAEGDGGELLVGTTRNALLRGSFAEGFRPIIQGASAMIELWGAGHSPTLQRRPLCHPLSRAHDDKQLCMWDGGEHTLAWSVTLEETGLCADFHPSGKVVTVGLSTGRWVVLDTETRQVLSAYTDGNEQLSVVRYSPDGEFLAIGSHDNFIYIYSVGESEHKYTRFGRCVGHSSFITHLDWSKDGNFIMSNSGDYEILYWDVAGGCKLLRNRFENKDREWASYTCVLGFHVFGVWPDGSDGTDINSLCRSHNERVVAVADDFCKVHLFQYPCAKPKAPSHEYGGHGSHVTNVRFTHNDGYLISMGGKDTSIFQWRVLVGSLPRSRSLSSASISSQDAGVST